MRHLILILAMSFTGTSIACDTGGSTERLNKANFDRPGVDAMVLGMVFMRGAECQTDFTKDQLKIANLSSKVYNEVKLAATPRCVSAIVRTALQCP